MRTLGRWSKAALVCAALPFVAGSLIFLMWMLTRAESLFLAGGLNIVVGVALSFVGFLMVVLQVMSDTRSKRKARADSYSEALFVCFCLGLNYPVAWGMLWTVREVHSRFVITVENAGDRLVNSFQVHGLEKPYELGPIA